ncbi:hypothetical protein BDR22DRAFT_207814 [Usnea florida]
MQDAPFGQLHIAGHAHYLFWSPTISLSLRIHVFQTPKQLGVNSLLPLLYILALVNCNLLLRQSSHSLDIAQA